MKNEVLIELKNVTLTFDSPGGKVKVLSDINFSMNKGEKLCIVGPSGCGKTTILNLVAGFLKPTEGQVLINNKPVDAPGADRTVVFQKDAVYPWLTVRKNLEYGPRARGIPKEEYTAKVNGYLEKVKLTDFADHYPKQLSGGMRKRVDIARAYVNSPEILLMDEPFGALDVMTKESMQKDLLKLVEEEKSSFLFITHDIEEAVFLGDRVLVMTARPAVIQSDIRISFAESRVPELKRTEKFQKLRGQISDILKGVE
jgi:NitT/TauT family transport system ATP-binding protein